MKTSKRESQRRLRQLVEEEHQSLLEIFQHHLFRAGLVTYETATTGAHEVLNKVVIEAMSDLNRFEQIEAPKAWLIGIGINLIKRQLSRHYRDRKREPLIRDLYAHTGANKTDDELFNQLMGYAKDPAQTVETQEQVDWMLSHVSERDQDIIRLAILHEFSGNMLAEAFGITPGAARVRLHRALRRLKTTLLAVASSESITGDTSHE